MRDEHDSAIHRIEAFSDGVFAIAITLLILEIGVPAVSSNQSLKHELLRQWPKYAAYALSFAMIGIYWANHNSFFRLFARADHTFLMLNVFFLMAIRLSAVPNCCTRRLPAGQRPAPDSCDLLRDWLAAARERMVRRLGIRAPKRPARAQP